MWRRKSKRLNAATVALAAAALMYQPGCAENAARSTDVSIIFTCDTRGRLEPCGCFEGQMGGLTRIFSLLQYQHGESDLRFDVGDVIGGGEDYNLIEFTYLLKAYADMKFDVMNPGHAETLLSAEQLKRLRAETPVPMVSANIRDRRTGELIFAPYRMLNRKGLDIAVFGVVDPERADGAFGPDLEIEDMASSLQRHVEEAAQSADMMVLLAFTSEERMAELAKQFYEIDVILGGAVAQPSQELVTENQSVILYTTNQARALGTLVVRHAADGSVSATSHDIQLVHDRIPEADQVLKLAADYKDEIRTAVLKIDDPEATRDDFVPGVRHRAEYMGTETCSACHIDESDIWRKTGHAHAFVALQQKNAAFDPTCVGCHTVGFGDRSGYRREYNGDQLGHVGCESCHGPGSLHVAFRTGDSSMDFKFRPLGAGDCTKCHFGEFSRPFDWDTFWPAVAHGKRVEPAEEL